jgi:hypothetical protein
MSYDVSLIDKYGNEVWERNMTSNVSQMWYEHFDTDYGLLSLQDMTWKEAKPHFAMFWNNLSNLRHKLYVDGSVGEPNFCAKYDAPNGWGSAVGAMIFIAEIQSAWAMNPKAKLSIWC